MNNEKDYTVSEVQTADMPDIKAIKKSHALFTHGIINLILPFLIWLPAMAVGLIVFAYIGIEKVGSTLESVIQYAILGISPFSSVVGIIRGIRHLKSQKSAKACLWLSIIGIVLFALIFAFVWWVGSNF